MNETAKVLEPLRRRLPVIPAPLEIDEDGEGWRRGFAGDISQSPLYVTDGHILLLASAVDPATAIGRNEGSYARKYATENAIGAVWKPAEEREDVAADFIGVCEHGDSVEVAFLRDTRGRVMVVDAHLLAFGIGAVHPDALTVSGAPMEAHGGREWFEIPLAFRSAGTLVGLLMPMKLSAFDFPQYDMHGEPVNLTTVMG